MERDGRYLIGGMEVFLESMITGDTDKAIRNQEKKGQGDLIHTDVLPRAMGHAANSREQFEAIGIVFGENVDDLFVQVTLPEGWKKEPTEHNMWSKLLDDKGRERAAIFYKAAFYDRKAHMTITRRYSFGCQPVGGWDQDAHGPREGIVTDCGEVIWSTGPMAPSEEVHWYELNKFLAPEAKKWLEEHYPDWGDPLACWD